MYVQQAQYIYKQETFTPPIYIYIYSVSRGSKRYSCSVHVQLHNFFYPLPYMFNNTQIQ